MYINVRTIDGKKNVVLTVSKTNRIEDLKIDICETLGIEPKKQRLFYRGKQLEDGHTIFDYNINVNDVVQLMIKVSATESSSAKVSEQKDETAEGSDTSKNCDVSGVKNEVGTSQNCLSEKSIDIVESQYFRVADLVDVLDSINGTWDEGKIIAIKKKEVVSDGVNEKDDGFIYIVLLDCNEEVEVILDHIRPRARHVVECSSLKIGDRVLANYNIDKPTERGHWYECTISKLGKINRTMAEVHVNIFLGNTPLIEDAKLKFCSEIFKLEERRLLTEIEENEYQKPVSKRKTVPSCAQCRDRPSVKCKDCGCHVCGLKTEPEKQIMCDECDMAFHLQCLVPPMDSIPEAEEWYCPLCKNDENEIVKPGEKLKKSKKKEKMASAVNSSSRDWGKGMACVGRTKECTLVPPNHYGPIPGVEVGTCWKFRLQVSEAGIHRPHVAGIHGRETDGAYSIVLSGGYEDDVDNGETFLYTGSGGRDLSGNKRTAEQSCDQTLTRMNKALALNCNAPLSDAGAKAKDWKKGKPIRVVRNYKAGKHSKYAPDDGNRYDGIYKVVEYYPQKGKSGFKVWRYVLRRDDPAPAPWTEEGKAHIAKLGLKMIYPEGYLEAEAAKVPQAKEDLKTSSAKKGKKRPLETNQLTLFQTKRVKVEEYSLDEEVLKGIQEDKVNEKLWKSCQDVVKEGKQKFLAFVSDSFMCICCQELVYEPISTQCKHNFCFSCLKRSFKAEVYSCPTCRGDLGQNFKMDVNKPLSNCLLKLFPGYEVGR
ncbi:Ubiquitin [Gryllus bimaculatus]|nr:Ubiquitin [Gryllus bimaculatus]